MKPKIILNKPKYLIHDFNMKVNTSKERINKQIQIIYRTMWVEGEKRKYKMRQYKTFKTQKKHL